MKYFPGQYNTICLIFVKDGVKFKQLYNSWHCDVMSFRVASLAQGQSYDCPSASDVTLKAMGKLTDIIPQQITTLCA